MTTVASVWAATLVLAAPADTAALLAKIKAVGREGDGNPAAAAAWKELVRQGPDALPAVLAALPDEEPTVANWLRTAVDAIAEKAAADKAPLPAKDLERFLAETRNGRDARRIAFELLTRADPKTRERLLPGMVLDPSPELRREAVARFLNQGRESFDADTATVAEAVTKVLEPLQKGEFPKAVAALKAAADAVEKGHRATYAPVAEAVREARALADKQDRAALAPLSKALAVLKQRQAKEDRAAAKAAYEKALTGAIDSDQVEELVKQLGPLGVKVDPATQLGFVRDWRLVAPFDNTDQAGFKVVFPPEKGVDLTITYPGKKGAEAKWVAHSTDDPYGLVELNKVLGKQKAVVAYAFATVEVPESRTAEVRAGCPTSLKVYVNGGQVFNRDEYHHGIRVDQHVAPIKLQKGRNEILVKVCQNDQKEDWAQRWEFQLRLCDATGVAIPFTTKRTEEKGR